MLEWFVTSTDMERALSGKHLLEEESVETRPERVPNCCINKNVNVHHINKYFTTYAWKMVCQILDLKTSQGESIYSCKVCSKELFESLAIACDCCLEWYHTGCVGLKNRPKRKEWFCTFCFVTGNGNEDLD